MELTWIDDFLALEQTRNFTRAATLRHTTQSAYSRRIARLEEWMGAPLFNREDRPITLTAQGAEFLPRAQKLRSDIWDTRRAVQVLGSHFDRPVRIYTTNTLATGFFPRWIAGQKMGPYTLVVASITACLDAAASGRCDQAIIPVFKGLSIPGQMKVTELGDDFLSLCARVDISKKITLDRKKITGPMMMYTPGTWYDMAIAEILKARKVDIAGLPVCESASAEALVAQAQNGLGAAWIPRSTMPADLAPCLMAAHLDVPYKIALVKRAG